MHCMCGIVRPLALLAFHLPREWLDITGAAFGAAAGSQLGAEAPSFTCNAACAADFGVVLAKVAANACVLCWYGVVLPRQAEEASSPPFIASERWSSWRPP